ncbi:MAG: uracil-DNA glycosylase [Pseudomonadota bacterium]
MTGEQARALLQFYDDAGVTAAEAETPGGLAAWPDAPKASAAPAPSSPSPPQKRTARKAAAIPADEAISEAEQIAAGCHDLESLIKAIAAFEGCPLREGAKGPVIYDGVLKAPVLVMGEAPGKEEDRLGKPFVGRSGHLLDRMLAAIDFSRAPSEGQTPVCISNAIFWRPPGNRNPSKAEVATCLPFMRRFIDLSEPALVILTGNVPTQSLFPDAPGITRSRGTFRDIISEGRKIPALPTFHPAFLLRQPQQKRLAWRDLLAVKSKLNEVLPKSSVEHE